MSSIQLSPLGTYQTGIFADSAAEIVAFDPQTNQLFVTNAAQNQLTILDASNPNNPTLVSSIDLSSFGGGINSVTVKNGLVAVAIEAEPKQNSGKVVFFNTQGQFLKQVTVGALPDMLTFTPDGTKVLVANEGEPNDDYSNDPVGSVSIINLSNGVQNATVTEVSFAGLVKQALLDQGIRIYGPGASVAQDLEPEYIAVSQDSKTAWVTLQENNALAKINLQNASVEILPLGYKDHSLRGNELDASDKDSAINIRSWPVFGMYQPDSIATYRSGGKEYLVMANEGDSRVYPSDDIEGGLAEGEAFSEEARVKDVILDPTAFPNAAQLQQESNLGRLKITKTLGDLDGDGDYEQLYAYGARSFSIRDTQGRLIYDSGADLEKITAIYTPANFNSDDEENDSFDARSDDKGPEPEALAVGEVDGHTYAFVGLERTGGIVVYDISTPSDPEFVQYINLRNFSGDLEAGVIAGTAGDSSPEGVTFIPASDSPTGRPLLAAANEISGSTTLYDISAMISPPEGAISGNNQDNKLYGTESANEIYGFSGRDVLYGYGGDDIIFGGEGNDEIRGHGGNDLIRGEQGKDKIKGDDGNDLIWGGDDSDTIEGNRGNDNLYGGEGNDTLYGGDDSDFIDGGLGDDSLYGGNGDDFLNGGYGYDYIDGGSGNDTVTMSYRHGGVNINLEDGYISFFDQWGSDTIRNIENAIGTEYQDYIEGNDQDNRLYGLGGDDIIVSGNGNDTLFGGAQDDTLSGEGGNDTLYGDEGDDSLFGGNGDDKLYGGTGDDFFDGGYGIDHFDGGEGEDTVSMAYRHAGVNINLAQGIISFFDQGGQETLVQIENAIGTHYADQIAGNRENNYLEGLGGNDRMVGVDPSQHLAGITEIDTLLGGEGGDRFVLGDRTQAYYNDGNVHTAGYGDYAHIKDFDKREGDIIELHGNASQYILASAKGSTGIFLKESDTPELIAIVEGLSLSTNLYSTSTFNYVS